MRPLNNTVMTRIETIVTTAVTGPFVTLPQAAGARLKPMRATIAPVTIGGMRRSIQADPTRWTMTPTTSRHSPTEMIPPCARAALWGSRGMSTKLPFLSMRPVTAPMGARSAKEEPR